MGSKERLQKEIDRLERYAKFYLSMLLAILSGIVWSIYAILDKKVNKDIMILAGVGAIIAIFIALKIKSIDYQEDELLEKLEKEE
jgi:drug/metabolite transporter (DMT)-like permease